MTFLLVGTAYALPFWLFPRLHPMNGTTSPEVLNLYCLVAWMGVTHFIYAYKGQLKASRRSGFAIFKFWGGLFISLVLLWGFRSWVSPFYFSFLAWIYFIPHFIKAELLFNGLTQTASNQIPKILYWFPTVGFAFFTVALFASNFISSNSGIFLVLALIILFLIQRTEIPHLLKDKRYSLYILLGFFFIAEGLVWARYHQYMVPQFEMGLYTFHIAVASIFHYLRAYQFSQASSSQTRPLLGLKTSYIIWSNLGIVVFCAGILHLESIQPIFKGLGYLIDPQFFTVWVALHLVASDWFSLLKHQLIHLFILLILRRLIIYQRKLESLGWQI
jgi:hypothetical protein